MYQILVDGDLFCDSRVSDLALIDPTINLEANKAGSMTFTIPPTHPYRDAITKRLSIIEVYRDDETEPLFEGVAVSVNEDFYKQRIVSCEGSLTFLNDSMQRPHKYQNVNVRQLLEAYIANHNALTEDYKHFTVGTVTVTDPNDYIYCFTNYESTLESIKGDLVDDLGGYLRIRHSNGVRYIDYLKESPNTCDQIVKLGENLINFKSTLDTTDISTVVIPRGSMLDESTIEGLDERVDIKSVNSGKDYVESAEAIENFGRIESVVVFDNVTSPTILKTKGEKYLSETQFADLVIEANAVDLYYDGKVVEPFNILDKIRVVSTPHGLNRYFVLTKQTIKLNAPEKDQITLGSNEKATLTAQAKRSNSEVIKRIDEIVPSDILESAKENATSLIKSAGNGYVTIKYDEDLHPTEILIMDTDDIETATKVWRWNLNGLGYSSTGYDGEYGTAITMDGSIVADYIKTGNLSASRINGGVLTLGGADNINGKIDMKNASGEVVGSWDNSGINAIGSFKSNRDSANIQAELFSAGLKVRKDDALKALIGATVSGVLALGGDQGTGIGNINGESVDYYYVYNNGLNYGGYTERHIFRGAERHIGSLYLGTSTARLYSGTYSGSPAVMCDNGFYAYGSMGCSGTKYRVVDTDHYGKVGMNAMESAEAFFSDLGSGTIGEDGTATILMDQKFSETVDLTKEYYVSLTRTSEKEAKWVEKKNDRFIVHGEVGATFDWIINCKQKDYSDIRMMSINIDVPEVKEEV